MVQPFPVALFAPFVDQSFNTAWTDGGFDNDSTNPLNWSNGAPNLHANVTFASNDACNVPLGMGFFCKSFNATGYTGEVTFNNGYDLALDAYGDVTINSGMGNQGTIRCEFMAPGTLTPGGFRLISIFGDNITLAGDATCQGMQVGGTFAIGNHVLTMGTVSLSGPGYDDKYFRLFGTMTWTAGGKIRVTSTEEIIEFRTTGASGIAPVELDAACLGVQLGAGGVKVASWTQAGGDLSDGGGTLNVVGNFVATGGSLTGSRVIVGGATATATGGMVIYFADFSGGTTLIATGCTDGGGNTNVTFI